MRQADPRLTPMRGNGDALLSEVGILVSSGLRQELAAWNDTEAEFPQDTCLHELVTAQAERTPQEVAVVSGSNQITYRDLDDQASRFGQYLRQTGVGPDKLVGICMDRSIDMVVSLLAILKAGGAYLPLDSEHPPERLAAMIDEAQPIVIITSERLRGSLPETDLPPIVFDRDRAGLLASAPLSGQIAEPNDLAYVLYTSGSTGKPKGVMVEHRAVVNHLTWRVEAFGFGPGDRVLQKAPLSFDVSVWEVFCPLICGATVVMLRPGAQLDPRLVSAAIRDERITLVSFAPSVLQLLVDTGAVREWSAVRLVAIGGEVLTAAVVRRLFEQLGEDVVVLNMYGPTEATVISTFWRCSPGDEVVPIGRPIANTQVYILDEQLLPSLPGVTGELYIGGAGLARGYLKRPDLTHDRFVASPFRSGERIYRTGDQARFRPDGNIEYLGRTDEQVKVRGHRIELGEVEAALLTHPALGQAVVVVRDDSNGNAALVAYIVPQKAGAPPTPAELREHLARWLMPAMMPSNFVVLDAIPLTSSGKVDRRALPTPSRHSDEYIPPRTALEVRVADIFANTLGVERVGVEDDFFELGGHSLLAARVVVRLGELTGRTVPLRFFFEHRTVASIAAELETAGGGEAVSTPPIRLLDRPEAEILELPCSFGQERLWFLAELDAEASRAYNVAAAFDISGEIALPQLERALNILVDRHEVLRTGLVARNGALHQSVVGAVQVPLTKRDTTDPELGQLLTEEARKPFDLSRPPLLRATVFCIAPSRHILILTMHHAVVDGWSLGMLGSELSSAYGALLRGSAPSLPELRAQYADFAAWQRDWMDGPELRQQLGYWRGQLSGVKPLDLPTDHPRPPRMSYRGHRARLVIPSGVVAGLEQIAENEGATLYMVLVAAFSTLLARLSGQEDLVIGSPIATRPRSELEPLIGFFVNTIALRCNLSGEPTFREVLRRVRETALAAFDSQDVPFEKVVEAAQPERNLARSPLFQAMLVLQEAWGSTLRLDGTTARRLDIDHGTSKFDLTLEFLPDGDHLEARLEANADLFDPESAQRLLERFRVLIDGVVRDPDRQIGRLELIPSEERELLYSFARTDATAPADACLHELFSDQAKRTPDAIALSCGSARLSYRELNERSTRLARYLQGQGVGRETLVALWLERSPELVVAILAVLKAGAAYVPIDPECPADRIKFMFEDSRIPLVLTQERLVAGLPERVPRVVVLERAVAAVETCSTDDAPVTSRPSDLAYVIYTSGSTGRPKGVQVEHRNVVRLFTATRRWFHPSEDDVWTLFHSYAFDFSVWELWGALLHGGRLVIVPQDVARSPEDFRTLLSSEMVTVLNQTPSAFAELIQADARADPGRDLALRLVIFGGEALDFRMLEPWFRRHGEARPQLVNMYGITETTVHVTYQPISGSDVSLPVSRIGRPIPDLSAYVCDRDRQPLQLVPLGVVGELYVGGAGVTRGYLNRPELTAQRFVPDPFATSGGRLYRTGDLVRLRPSGDLDYVGRSDFQIKVRGFRIEPGEVEAAILSHPAVRQAVVLVQKDTHGDPLLVGYVVGRGGAQPPAAAELRALLKASLPSYMVPSAFVELEALPLDANGKVDRKALPNPEYRDYQGSEYVAPRSTLELRLAEIFGHLLGLKQVGIRDDFFDLGGHSLQAVRLLREIESTLGVKVPLASIFQGGSSVAGMASVVEASSIDQADSGPLVPIQSGGSAPVLFFVHPDEAALLSLRHLVNLLDSEQRVVGLLPDRVARHFDPARGIEDLAEPMVASIRATQPFGPYLLAGFSLGGLLAYEIAGRLQAEGEEVAWLGIVDAAVGRAGYQGALWPHTLGGFIGRLRQLGPKRAALVAKSMAWRWTRPPLVRLHWVSPLALGYDFDYRGASVLGANYAPTGHAVPMDLFTSADNVEESGSPTLGWENVHRGSIKVHASLGSHFSLVSESSQRVLAESVSASLRHGQTDPSSGAT
jgi:amino acid adenylation domain-containing protein